MSDQILKYIENILDDYFPVRWSADHILSFVGGARFSRSKAVFNHTLNEPIRDFIFRGGKRLRPVLFLLLLKSFGLNPQRYIHFAFFIELIHNGTLVIDDIEDNSAMRRGKPTLHKLFGLDVAVNTGVAMHLLPLVVLLRKAGGISDEQRLRVFEIYSEELIRLYFGQAVDIHWHRESPITISVDEYLEMTRLKTGSLMRVSARLACVFAQQDRKVEQDLQAFAESAGIAFQIKDDVLDLTADPKTFGKAFGNDITEGKISLPVIFALQALAPADKKQLVNILHQHTRDPGIIAEAHALIGKTGAIDRALELAQTLLTDAWDKARHSIPAGEGRDALEVLVMSFIRRDH